MRIVNLLYFILQIGERIRSKSGYVSYLGSQDTETLHQTLIFQPS